MRAGKLRNLVVIERPGTATQDSTGQPSEEFEPVAEAYASIEQLSARERFNNAQVIATATHRIMLRWQPELDAMDASWRVAFGDKTFTLVAPPNNVEQRNREIELQCQEGPYLP